MNQKQKDLEPAVQVKNLSVAYGDKVALWDANFTIPKGKLVAIIGPNGAGKSTLLKAILGLIKPFNGSVEIFGKPLRAYKKRHEVVGYVPQRESVDWDFPTTCLDVVLMGRYGHLGWFKRPGKKEKELAMNALKRFGMEDFHDHQISELSGGQKQRVFLARALVQDPLIYFLDEPFGGVDITTEHLTLELFKELRDQGKTIIVVTHDLQTLKQFFDYAILINKRIIAHGHPSHVLVPEHLQVTYGGHLHVITEAINLEL